MKIPQTIGGLPALEVLIIGAVVLYVMKNGIAGTVANVIGGAGTVANDAVAGVVTGIGQDVGVPTTNAAKCQAAMAAGDSLSASFYCDATTYENWLYSSGQGTLGNFLNAGKTPAAQAAAQNYLAGN